MAISGSAMELAVMFKAVDMMTAPMGKIQAGLTATEAKAQRTAQVFRQVGNAIAMMGSFMAFNFVKDSIKVQAEFDHSMKTVQAVSQGTEEELKSFTETARRLGETTIFKASEVANGMKFVAMAGIANDKIEKVTESGLKLAQAAGTDIGRALDITTDIMTAFNLEAEDLNRINDTLAYTFMNTNTNLELLGETMKYAAPVANAAGRSIEEVSAAAGLLGSAGIKGSSAGTSIAQAISKMLKPGGEAVRTMQELGLNFVELRASGQTAWNALNQNRTELQNLQFQIMSTRTEMKGLADEMKKLGIEQSKNTLEIMKIEQQADREKRELTEGELARIDALKEANDELAISIKERDIKSKELSITEEGMVEKEKKLEEAVKSNERSVQHGITGVKSFSDILHQLEDASVGAADMMEIFGIRGGRAMLALQSQGAEAFDSLHRSLINDFQDPALNATGSTQEAFNTMSESSLADLKKMESQIESVKIGIGEGLMPIVSALTPHMKTLTEVALILTAVFVAYKIATTLAAMASLYKAGADIAASAAAGTYTGSAIKATVAQWLFNKSLFGCPLVWILLAIVAVIAIVVVLEKKFGIITKTVKFLSKVFGWFGDKIKEVVGFGKEVVIGYGNIWIVTFNKIIGGFNSFMKLLTDGFNKIISLANKAIGWANKVPGVNIKKIGKIEAPKIGEIPLIKAQQGFSGTLNKDTMIYAHKGEDVQITPNGKVSNKTVNAPITIHIGSVDSKERINELMESLGQFLNLEKEIGVGT